MARFTFNDATFGDTFEDLFEDSQGSNDTWYRLWTGDATGSEGDYVDTSAFNSYGKGWIESKELSTLDIDFQQYQDTTLWVQAWEGSAGDWESGTVDFSVGAFNDITTDIDQDYAMNQMFTNYDAASGTWYQLWIGDQNFNVGNYVDTSVVNNTGNGWVEAEDLSDLTFSLTNAGNDLWVRIWTPEDGRNTWEHWTVNDSTRDIPHSNVELPSGTELDWTDLTQTDSFPYQAIGRLEVDYNPFDNSISVATGFLISPEHVLTNAHAVLNASGVFDPTADIQFYPGLNGDRDDADDAGEVYGWASVEVQREVSTNNLYASWPDDDLAIIQLSETIGDTLGYFNFRGSQNDDLNSLNVIASGYPSADIDQEDNSTSGKDIFQWGVLGRIEDYTNSGGTLELSGSMDSTGGASGSPIFYAYNDEYYAVGVYSGSLGNTPVAASFDKDSYNWILGVLQSDGYYLDVNFA
ncbi:MAG: trypsin-like serine protease [Desulfobacteraceae bacterium]|nr:trypsin-like serine protease [Desulfobacteraceae bacterium]